MSDDDLFIRVLLLLAVSLVTIAFAWRARVYNRGLAPAAHAPAATAAVRTGEGAPAPMPPGTPFRDPMAESMLRELYRRALGVTRIAHALPDEHAAVLDELRRAPFTVFPEPPALLAPLLAARGDDATAYALLDALEGDPPLAAAVLALARDPAFGHAGEPFATPEQALAALGVAPLGAVIASALLQPAFGVPEEPFAAFAPAAWLSALQSALATAASARAARDCAPLAAHVLGLVHALGAVTAFRTALDHYHRECPALAPRAEVLASVVTERADAAAHALAIAWNLPAALRSALAEHSAQRAPGAMSPLGRALYAGRLLGLAAVLRGQDALDESGFGELLARKGLGGAHALRLPGTAASGRVKR